MAPFGRRTSIVLPILSVCTLYIPFASVSTPVFGRTQWTALDLFLFVHSESTSVLDVFLNQFVTGIGIAYACLLVFLVLLWIPSSRSLLRVTAIVGTMWACEPFFCGTEEIAKLWFGSHPATPLPQIRYGPGVFVLPAMMAGLWWMTTKSADLVKTVDN